MLVRYFMTSIIVTLAPDQTCFEALLKLQKHNIRRAPVMDENEMVGIVSERDLYRALPGTVWLAAMETGGADMDITVKDVMTTDVQVLNPNDHIEIAARLMLKYKIGGVPVVKDEQLVGLITESDVFKSLWKILSHTTDCRILFFDKEDDTNKAPNDYIELCFRHHCLVHTYVSYPEPDGGNMHYLCLQGAGVDDLIKDLWARNCHVVIVEKENEINLSDNPQRG